MCCNHHYSISRQGSWDRQLETHIDDAAARLHVMNGLLSKADHAHNVDHESLLQTIPRDVPEILLCISL